jgi:hypothetical protein
MDLSNHLPLTILSGPASLTANVPPSLHQSSSLVVIVFFAFSFIILSQDLFMG